MDIPDCAIPPFFRKSKAFSIFFYTVLAAPLLGFFIAFLLLPKGVFSEEENRPLSGIPSFRMETLLDGSYTERLSNYVRDHIPLRGVLLKTKSATELALLKGENNGVIFGKNGYLIKRFSYSDEQLTVFQSNTAAIFSLCDHLSLGSHPSVFLCAPRAIDVLLSTESPLAPTIPEERSVWHILSENAPNAITMTRELSQRAAMGEQVWFQTDHHWTALGAYYAYQQLGEHLGYLPLPRTTFLETTVSQDFYGTSYSAALFPLTRADDVIVFRYAKDGQFIVTDGQTGQSREGFYEESALDGKDHYSYFLGGNTAHLTIVKDPQKPRPTLLVIKDSYANALIPFLARHFDIEMLDLRYMRGDATEAVQRIVSGDNYYGALILYNADTLTGNAGLGTIDLDKLQ